MSEFDDAVFKAAKDATERAMAKRKKIDTDDAESYRAGLEEAEYEDFEIKWTVLPTDETDTPYVEIGGDRYRLPYYDLIPQSVDPEALLRSIQQDGVREPVEVEPREDGYDVIDGNTRAYIAWILDLDDLPTKEIQPSTEAKDEEGTYHRDLDAIVRNTQRRQLTPTARRQLIPRIKSAMGWRKVKTATRDGRQARLAQILGVSEATISRDIATLDRDDTEDEKAQLKRKINSALTGLRYIDDMDDLDLSDAFSDEEIKLGRSYVEALARALENRREALDQEEDE